MRRRRILDTFCCEGGGARGYALAGWDVYGVDLFKHKNAAGRTVGFSQKRYPYASHQGDVLAVLRILLDGGEICFTHPDGRQEWLGLADFDAIHASPPCQAFSITRHGHDVKHPELIEPTRALLVESGLPYVIENVEGAPLLEPTLLCWAMFYAPGSVLDDDGTPLRMERHRLFETNWHLRGAETVGHPHTRGIQVAGSYGGARRDKLEARLIRKGGYVPSKAVQQSLLKIDWMTEGGMHQCIPPAYTRWIGQQLVEHLDLAA